MKAVLLIASLLPLTALAEEPAGGFTYTIPPFEEEIRTGELLWRIQPAPMVDARRLIFLGSNVAYFNYKAEVLQPNFSAQGTITRPFTGLAVWKGDDWLARVTYKEGILDGEVKVFANNKLLYRFRYEKGMKVVENSK